ncbi:YtxH domain-containing protein [Olivibacter sp. SDN3]|uniref:YtxH domain-containing protein n=1 Tax=Olivibacter sp. SDN3 TaxID=2764720 RepID=UPI0016512A4A|nr:YtxH domain-containing protein [Olivibacter sp. SDN3]QNL47935.1 YtxH domain-containing protein [Olivibacter sp. SDN3]
MGKLITFLGGVATGLAIGMLFAPLRGRETREQVDHSVRELAQGLKEATGEQLERFRNLKDRLAYAISRVKDREEIEKMVDEHAWI